MGRRVVLAALLTAGLSVLGAGAAAADTDVINEAGPLTDLSAAANPTDGAEGRLIAYETGDGTTRVWFIATGLDPAAEGNIYGTHVHVGPCVPRDGAAAGPHYNIEGPTGPPDTEHEIWLDFTVEAGGVGFAQAEVPFQIPDGDAQSVVIHALPTEPGTGLAGGRIACLPVEF